MNTPLQWESPHRDLLAALEAEENAAYHTGTVTHRALTLIDLRRDIARRHAPITLAGRLVCDFCSDDIGRIADWPCPDYLAVAKATLPADHPALTA